MVQSSTDQLTSTNLNIAFSIAERVLIIGNFTSDYIQLVDNLLNILVADYSLEMLPGRIVTDIQVNSSIYYYKQRELSVNFANTSILFNNDTHVKIIKLPFESDIIVNAIIISYPQPDNISSIISINFTSSGTYMNQVFNMTPEQLINLNESAVQILMPINNNASKTFDCISYNEGTWQSNGCSIIQV